MANGSLGNVVGAGVGPDEKWALRSRQVLAMLAIAGQLLGLGENEIPVLQGIGEHGMALAALVLMVWHWRRPDGAELRLWPKMPSSEATSALAVVLTVGLVVPGCTFLGHKGTTLEQEFYEVDAMTTLGLEGAAAAIGGLQDQGIRIPPDVRSGLRVAVRSLRQTRIEVRKWVAACGRGQPCPSEARIRLGMGSMESLIDLIANLVLEAKEDG